MAFAKQTIKDVDLTGKRVLVRVDYNVLDEAGKIVEDYRLTASLPTLEYLKKQNCAVVLISHAGRPDGKVVPALSLKPVADRLSAIIKQPVLFVDDCVGADAAAAAKALKPGEILVLENLRFHADEEANEPEFAQQLASLGEVFVLDGFAVAHRAHASTVGVTKYLPSAAGFLLEKEVTRITAAMEHPKRPFVAILGGAKVSDKIDLVNKFLDKADALVIGGAMANTFLAAEGYKIGSSIYEADKVAEAKQLLSRSYELNKPLVLPSDVVISQSLKKAKAVRVVDWGTVAPDLRHHPTDEVPKADHTVGKDDYILDLGPATTEKILGLLTTAGTVIWNGPVGLTETKPFDASSDAIEDVLCKLKADVVVGGGDTAAFVMKKWADSDPPYFVSTGGGASLELMAGKTLPGFEALADK